LGTGSTFEYAAEPHAGRGSIGDVLVSVNVPPKMSGSVLTKAGAVPVHGDTMKRTAPRADSKISRVFAPVCPTKPVVSCDADTCALRQGTCAPW
jgi:hypothetical protein